MAPQKQGRSKWLTIGLPVAIVAIIIAAVVGGVVGSRSNNNSNKEVSSAPSSSSSSSSSSSHSSSSSSKGHSPSASATSTTSSAAATPTAPIVDLVKWDFSKNKSIGMNLGNFLILERWMNEDWFIEKAGPNAWDEFHFTSSVGANASAVLQEHWNSWVTEADIEDLYQSGFNHLRIPLGFWALIPTVAGEPYLNMGGQMDQYQRIMEYCYARKMYVIFDLHGLPGSQDGEQQSGWNTTSPTWYTQDNQDRSDAFVLAAMDWIAANPYRSVISSIGIANEPRAYTAAQYAQITDYYSRSYTAIQASKYPIPVIIHHAFAPGGIHYWTSWVAARVTTPPSVVIEDHPYPGNFPPQTVATDIMQQVCTDAAGYVGFPSPVIVTEFSLYTGIKQTAFEQSFYNAQLVAWAWSAGATYWSLKLIPSAGQLAGGLDYSQYSWQTMKAQGAITLPSSATESTTDFLNGLGALCGPTPT